MSRSPMLLSFPALAALSLVSAFCMPLVTTAAAFGAITWGYNAINGPTMWGSLSVEFETCDTGKQQSPINLSPADAKPNVFPSDFQLPSFEQFEITNMGHTIAFTPTDSKSRGMSLQGEAYSLQQITIHTPSEHRINGGYFAGEMHLVHMTPDQRTAIVGVLIEESTEDNPAWADVLKELPSMPEMSVVLNAMLLDTADFVNVTRGPAFNYVGSLTTPPCSEQVSWFIPRTAIKMSAKQLHTFSKMIGFTSRPTMFNENVKSSQSTGDKADKAAGNGVKTARGARTTPAATGRATATARLPSPTTSSAKSRLTSAHTKSSRAATTSTTAGAAKTTPAPAPAPEADKRKEEEGKKKAEEEKKKAEDARKRAEEEDLDKPLPNPKKKKAQEIAEESENSAPHRAGASSWILSSGVAAAGGLVAIVW